MSDSCNHKCESCSRSCSDRTKESLLAKLNEKSKVKKVIAVVSGKGGVGKSMVTSQLAVLAARKGKRVAVMDADITGPSIPRAFGITAKAESDGKLIYPVLTKKGMQIMSLNLLVENETDPVVWRGPIIAGMVKQFWTDVVWDDVEYMFVDMPPGTGDVPLTVFQSLPIDGIVIVLSPQELVGMIAQKAVNMAKLMNIPILGMVENMSYLSCPGCGTQIPVFGESRVEKIATENGIANIAKLPVNPVLAATCDQGKMEDFEGAWLEEFLDHIIER